MFFLWLRRLVRPFSAIECKGGFCKKNTAIAEQDAADAMAGMLQYDGMPPPPPRAPRAPRAPRRAKPIPFPKLQYDCEEEKEFDEFMQKQVAAAIAEFGFIRVELALSDMHPNNQHCGYLCNFEEALALEGKHPEVLPYLLNAIIKMYQLNAYVAMTKLLEWVLRRNYCAFGRSMFNDQRS